NPMGVTMATTALGAMGSNAAPAIPALVEVCENGVASPRIAPLSALLGSTPTVMFTNTIAAALTFPNRLRAMTNLALIGIASPEVLATLKRGTADPNLSIQLAAYQALHALHQPIDATFTNWLANLPPTNRGDNLQIVRWVGTLGAEGRETIPWLRQQ